MNLDVQAPETQPPLALVLFFCVCLTADTMPNGLSGRPFDTCDQVKNERNAFALDLCVGLLLSSLNQANIISGVICKGPT